MTTLALARGGREHLTRRSAPLARVLAVLVIAALGLTTQAPHAAAAVAAPSVTSVTPWVRAGETWTATFDPTALDPRGFVSVTVHGAVRGTDTAVAARLAAQQSGRDLGGVVASLPTERLLALARGVGSLAVAITVESADRTTTAGVRLGEPGIYPVEVRFSDVDGIEVASRVLHLVLDGERPDPPATTPTTTTTAPKSPSPTEPPPAIRTVVLVDGGTEPAYAPDGEPLVDAARATAERTVTVLGDDRPAAVCTVLRAEVLESLATSPDEADRALLERLIALLRTTRAVRAPWAPLHLDAWVNQGGTGEVARSMVAAQDTARSLARQILDPRVWPPDETVDNSSIDGLETLGVSQLLVDDGQLSEARLPAGERGYNRPIRVGSGSATLPAMVADPRIAEDLRAPIEPALAVNRAVTRLAAQTLALDRRRGRRSTRAALVVLDDRTPAATAAAFVAALAPDDGPIAVTPPEDLFSSVGALTRNADGSGSAVVRSFRPVRSTASLDATIRALPAAWTRGEAARQMRPSDDPLGTSVRIALLGVTRRDAGAAERRDALTRATRLADSTLHAVTAPARRTVTVTARAATIPLRVTNTATVPLRVRMRFESPRLQFTEGADHEVVLAPGVNRFDVPVRVRSSGEFVLRVAITSPDSDAGGTSEGLPLSASTVTVRSTAFSGVGLILSGGALLVLVVWWGRTLRRSRHATSLPGTEHDRR